ncbi:MAG: DNA replication and repair protein RecF, partial [Gammaproteobacteria bacterium]|nr:DNA replication and repair protein RecF [Gammaproteobacteria bacterium]
ESFPVQLVDSQAHLLVNGGPRYRRQFLDWGVFHVEPDFFPAWQRYRRILRQRNALLRSGKPTRELTSWDRELISSGEILDRSRRDYLAVFASQAARWARQALGEMEVGLEYRPGWPDDLSLQEALKGSADRDRQTGTTQVGPHRADILIKVAEKAAQARVSRGQEKVLAGALLLAQAALYRSIRGRACTLLLDDLAAELDAAHLARFLDMVDETSAQVFLTAIEPSPLITTKADRVFHVKQGEISRMV